MTKISEEIIFPGEASPCIFDPNLYEDDCDPIPAKPTTPYPLWIFFYIVFGMAFCAGLVVGILLGWMVK